MAIMIDHCFPQDLAAEEIEGKENNELASKHCKDGKHSKHCKQCKHENGSDMTKKHRQSNIDININFNEKDHTRNQRIS